MRDISQMSLFLSRGKIVELPGKGQDSELTKCLLPAPPELSRWHFQLEITDTGQAFP